MTSIITFVVQWGPHRGPHGPVDPHVAGGGPMPWTGAGGVTTAGWLPIWLAIALTGLVFVAVLLVMVRRSDRSGTDIDAMAVLNERYARGEIDDDEFDRRRRRLFDGSPR